MSEINTKIEILDEKKTNNVMQGFLNLPTSPATDALLKVFSNGDDLLKLKDKVKSISHGQTIEVLANGLLRRVIFEGKDNTVTLELNNINQLSGCNKTIKKLFIFLLIKANERAVHNGILSCNSISFPLQELIDLGFYMTPQSARRGFDDGMTVLTGLKVKGSLQKGKKNKFEQSAIEVLFTGARRANGQCVIYLNERVNWEFIMSYYTLLPRYAFSLSNRAFDLLYYIFYLARQKVREIKEKESFNVSLKAIHSRLDLPDISKTKNPKRDIREQIEFAVNEINNAVDDPILLLEIISEPGVPIMEYVNNGYLQITMKGECAERFIYLSKNKTKKIEEAKHREEVILERAKAMKVAKKQ